MYTRSQATQDTAEARGGSTQSYFTPGCPQCALLAAKQSHGAGTPADARGSPDPAPYAQQQSALPELPGLKKKLHEMGLQAARKLYQGPRPGQGPQQ